MIAVGSVHHNLQTGAFFSHWMVLALGSVCHFITQLCCGVENEAIALMNDEARLAPPAITTFLSEQISTSHQPPAK
jgi:hypothetical protein